MTNPPDQESIQTSPPRRLLAQSKPINMLRRTIEFITAMGVAGYAILICVQVFYRFALNSSLTWSEELVQFMLLWTVMLGSAMATDRGAHIVLNPLDSMLSDRNRRIVNGVASLGTITFCLLLAYYGYQLIMRTLIMRSPATDIPMSWVYAAMPVGALLIVVFAVVHLIDGTDMRMDPMDERS